MLPRRLSLLIKRSYSNHIINSAYGEVAIPDVTIDQFVWENISKWENKTAVECGVSGKKYTFKELRNRSRSFGVSLSSLGLSGKTALMVLSNCPEFPLAVLGSMEAGMSVSSANPSYTSGEIQHQARDSGANCIITEPGCLEQVISAKLGLPIICTGEKEEDNILSFNEMIETSFEGKSTPKAEDRFKQLALLPYSSGTTGLPKGVRLTHRNIVANLSQVEHPLVKTIQDTTVDHQDTLIGILPFFHIYGSTVVMLQGLRKGAKLITLPKFEPASFLRNIKNNKDIVLYCAPPIINFLAWRSDVLKQDLEGLRDSVTGAAPCKATDIAKLKEKKDHYIYQAYGMTEAAPILTYSIKERFNTDSIGEPIANTLARVIDTEDGKPVPTGLQGELCFKGPQVMEGYHNNPKATAETIDGEGWLHTGDIGYANKEGQIFIVDRLKELIKVKGFQVAPAELEGLLRQHPDVLDVGVTAVPSTKSGELPVAFLVPKPDKTINEASTSDWVAKQVAPYKKLAKIITVTEIPKSASGKILRRKLKEIAANEVRLD